MSIAAQQRWIQRIWSADKDALERIRTALEAVDEDAADRYDGAACDRIADLMMLVDCRIAKGAAEHKAFMGLGDRLHVDAPAVKVIRRPARRLAPRRRGAGRPAGHRPVRRRGASSPTSSADPGDEGSEPPAPRRRCRAGRRRSDPAS